MIEELAGEAEALAPAQVHVQRRGQDGVQDQEFGREDLAEHGGGPEMRRGSRRASNVNSIRGLHSDDCAGAAAVGW